MDKNYYNNNMRVSIEPGHKISYHSISAIYCEPSNIIPWYFPNEKVQNIFIKYLLKTQAVFTKYNYKYNYFAVVDHNHPNKNF